MVSEKIERTRVSFDSGGVELVGYLHRPADSDGQLPGVVMGHGFGGTQDRLLTAAELMRAHRYSHLPRSVLFLLLAVAALVLDLSS